MSQPRILLFDSGMGGLTVARSVRHELPFAHLVYSADNAAFPYGAWEERALVQRILSVMGKLIERVEPGIVVIACNTASTIALAQLREKFDVPFVGTVPAIKPAAAQSKSHIIGVLATPGTVRREYTHALIHDFASHCHVSLHGAPKLAEIAERKLKGVPADLAELKAEIAPVFVEEGGRRTDVVVLGCTHYPLLADEMAKVEPWVVRYIDPAPAIARRVADVLKDVAPKEPSKPVPPHNSVLLTSTRSAAEDALPAYAKMSFHLPEFLDLKVQ
ncbi:MAG: glutamate racemase [Aestuariivirga sp.]|uniref:glutamate racemase n=1 Tax=Aestuariivirga sp. TaxID=2650926 RepID=UPI0025BF9F14|nr:glutamate racemase [Aestuariivirga sp.]MCA3561059.1 glutamate racemase [Aestuariivirga sp.]